MISTDRIQKVIFVRHGVAKHNLPDSSTGKIPDLRDPALTDPPLVYQGKQQALHAGQKLKELRGVTQQGIEIDLVVTSPLTRCIQTSMLIFFPGDRYTSGGSREPVFFCTDLCREAVGMHYPDKRRECSLLMKHWPMLQIDPKMKELDEAWQEERRETISELGLRISLFLEFLVSRSENNIVVVTHGVWLEECFRLYCPSVLDNGRRRVYNCDMFALDCVSRDRRFLKLENPHQI